MRVKPLYTWRSAICDSELHHIHRHVALVLSLHMSERGDSCFPSIPKLAKETGLGRTAIIAAIKAIEEAGYLVVRRPKTKGRGRFNRYEAVLPRNVREADHSLEETSATDQRMVREGCNKRPPRGLEDVSLRGLQEDLPLNKPNPNPNGAAKAREILEDLARKKGLGDGLGGAEYGRL